MKRIYIKSLNLAIAGLIFMIACQSPVNKKTEQEVKDNKWIEEMTISKLKLGYRNGDYSVTDVVSAYLDMIIELDMNGPELNSIIMVNPEALQIAEEMDIEMAAGKIRGPLHGIPVILKDNIDTYDKMPTTAGATVLMNS
ncbi:MAG: amidase [Bacteroidota bacterium]|nr:amidase [Bacteroidota bacterium]